MKEAETKEKVLVIEIDITRDIIREILRIDDYENYNKLETQELKEEFIEAIKARDKKIDQYYQDYPDDPGIGKYIKKSFTKDELIAYMKDKEQEEIKRAKSEAENIRKNI